MNDSDKLTIANKRAEDLEREKEQLSETIKVYNTEKSLRIDFVVYLNKIGEEICKQLGVKSDQEEKKLVSDAELDALKSLENKLNNIFVNINSFSKKMQVE